MWELANAQTLFIGNFLRLAGNDHMRAIQLIFIFAIGALTALRINEIVALFKPKSYNVCSGV